MGKGRRGIREWGKESRGKGKGVEKREGGRGSRVGPMTTKGPL